MAIVKGSVVAILVTWNSSANALLCVESLRQSAPCRDLRIVVVDNDSRPAERNMLLGGNGFTLLEMGANLGFAAACNRGAEASAESYLLFVNPDVVAIGEAVETLSCWLDEHPSAAGAAGMLVDAREQPDIHFMLRRLPSVRSVAYDALLLHRIWTPMWRRRLAASIMTRVDAQAVEQPPAACLMVRKSVFEAVGGFDPVFYPAWYEDVDLCRRLRNAGHRLYLLPPARFCHGGHASLSELSWGDFLETYYRNQRRYFEKHHSRIAVAAVRGLVCLGMTMRLAMIPFIWDRRAGCRGAAATAYLRIAGTMLQRERG